MSYDHLVSFYDPLARIVFGRAIFESQKYHFGRIENRSRILVVGGGTGWILEYLPAWCSKIIYVEPSFRMIKKSRERATEVSIDFIQQPVESISFNDEDFDLIITNFFLDQFEENQCVEIIKKLKKTLRNSGKWILTDFQNNGKWWQKGLLTSMYYFFSISTGLSTRRLPELNRLMTEMDLKILSAYSTYDEFIFSNLYQKITSG